MRCWPGGQVEIATLPPAPPCREFIQLPSTLDTQSAQALFTAASQCYVRINAADHAEN